MWSGFSCCYDRVRKSAFPDAGLEVPFFKNVPIWVGFPADPFDLEALLGHGQGNAIQCQCQNQVLDPYAIHALGNFKALVVRRKFAAAHPGENGHRAHDRSTDDSPGNPVGRFSGQSSDSGVTQAAAGGFACEIQSGTVGQEGEPQPHQRQRVESRPHVGHQR